MPFAPAEWAIKQEYAYLFVLHSDSILSSPVSIKSMYSSKVCLFANSCDVSGRKSPKNVSRQYTSYCTINAQYSIIFINGSERVLLARPGTKIIQLSDGVVFTE